MYILYIQFCQNSSWTSNIHPLSLDGWMKSTLAESVFTLDSLPVHHRPDRDRK